MRTNLMLRNIDIDILLEQYEELQNMVPADNIVWGLIESIGDALEGK